MGLMYVALCGESALQGLRQKLFALRRGRRGPLVEKLFRCRSRRTEREETEREEPFLKVVNFRAPRTFLFLFVFFLHTCSLWMYQKYNENVWSQLMCGVG